MDADVQRTKLLNLNRLQTWLIIFGTGIGIVTAVTAWAHGWLGLPDKVNRIEVNQRPLMELPHRVTAIEDDQRLLWSKVAGDHDLLISINQKLTDVNQQQQELRQDLKDSRK